jgi:hypothetical protein
MDKTIWDEVFEIAISYEKTNVEEYNYQIKRLRDLKNTYDYYKELGRQEGLEIYRLERIKSLKDNGRSEEEILEFATYFEKIKDKL